MQRNISHIEVNYFNYMFLLGLMTWLLGAHMHRKLKETIDKFGCVLLVLCVEI